MRVSNESKRIAYGVQPHGRVAAPHCLAIQQFMVAYKRLYGSRGTSPEVIAALRRAMLSMFETVKQQNYSKGAYDAVARARVHCSLAGVLLLGSQYLDTVHLAANGLTEWSSADKTGNAEWTLMVVLGSGVVPSMACLLNNSNAALRHTACQFIGNLAVTDSRFRDELLVTPAVVQGLVNNLTVPIGYESVNGASEAISALCAGTFDNLSAVESFVEPLVQWIQRGLAFHKNFPYGSPDIFLPAITALKDLVCVNRTQPQVRSMYNKTILVTIMKLMRVKKDHANVVGVSLSIIGDYIWASVPDVLEVLNNNGFFPFCIDELLDHDSNMVSSKTCWALANISADTDDNKEYLFTAGNGHELVDMLVQKALFGRWATKREASFAILQLILLGTRKQVDIVVKVSHGLRVVSNVLEASREIDLVMLALDAINSLLELNQALHKEPRYHQLLDMYRVVQEVEKLTHAAHDQVSSAALKFMEQHFDNDDNAPVPQQLPAAAAAASANIVGTSASASASTSPPSTKKRRA